MIGLPFHPLPTDPRWLDFAGFVAPEPEMHSCDRDLSGSAEESPCTRDLAETSLREAVRPGR